MSKKEDSVILFKEIETGKFERIVFFVFADEKNVTYSQYEFDSVMYEAFHNMNDEGQERFLNRLVKDNMYDKIKDLNPESLNVFFESNKGSKQKYREFKLNKIID